MFYLTIRYKLALITMLYSSFIIFGSCSKEKSGKYHTVVSGKILDFHTGEPIPNARVVLADGRIITDSFFGWGDDNPMVEKAIDFTDENGSFFVELKNHYNSPILAASAENYSEGDYTITGYRLYDSYIDHGVYTDLVLRKKKYGSDD